jgi:predicted nucleic acid-binding protein
MLLDSNIIIGATRPEGGVLVGYVAQESACISIVTAIETLGFHRLSEEEEQAIQAYLGELPQVPLNQAVASRAIALRKQRKMGLADAILAATALEWDIPLVTCNSEDFKHVAGLKVIAPELPKSSPGLS